MHSKDCEWTDWAETAVVSVSVGALFAALFGFTAYQINAKTASALGSTEVVRGTATKAEPIVEYATVSAITRITSNSERIAADAAIKAYSTFSIEITERPQDNELRLFVETDSAIDPIITLARMTGFPPISLMKARGENRNGKLGINLNIHFSSPENFTYDQQALTLTILQPGAKLPFEMENIY